MYNFSYNISFSSVSNFYKMRLNVLMVFFVLGILELSAQTLTPAQWKKIVESSDYIIGQGVNSDLEQARQSALSSLVSNISVNVSSQFSYSAAEETKDNQTNSEEKVNSIIKSYSTAALNNVDEYVEHNKGDYTVYRYMKRSDLRAMFKKRVALARKWIWEARRSYKDGKTGDALRDYYWALLLLRSCPDADLEVFEDENGEHNMMQFAFGGIKDILSLITIEATELEMKDGMQHVTLRFCQGNEPLTNFNYRYHDGKNTSELYTAKDGSGEIVLPAPVKLSKVKIQAEYECRDEANINPDLRCVIQTTEPVPLPAAMIKIGTKNCKGIDSNNYFLQVAQSPNRITPVEDKNIRADTSKSENITNATQNNNDVASDLKSKCMEAVEIVQKAIATKTPSSARSVFTDLGWDMFTKLMTYGNVRLLRQPEVSLEATADGMICRSLPMSFAFKGNTRSFTEDVVLYLNSDGKVNEVAFGLEKLAVDDIMKRGDWDLQARQLMVHFLETYKTAYALKRLEYINSIFSNDALIITGSVVYSSGKGDIGPSLQKHVKYTRQTKAEYMTNLERCFKSNEFVNIRFADNVVRRSHTNPNIYGIQIKQDYFSSSYGDTGYLFLMIDFADPNAPLIHVRTWQPDLDPNTRDGRIGMADFQL